MLGRTRFRGRCWAAIWLSDRHLPVSLLIVLHTLRLEWEKSMELTASSHPFCFFCSSRGTLGTAIWNHFVAVVGPTKRRRWWRLKKPSACNPCTLQDQASCNWWSLFFVDLHKLKRKTNRKALDVSKNEEIAGSHTHMHPLILTRPARVEVYVLKRWIARHRVRCIR